MTSQKIAQPALSVGSAASLETFLRTIRKLASSPTNRAKSHLRRCHLNNIHNSITKLTVFLPGHRASWVEDFFLAVDRQGIKQHTRPPSSHRRPLGRDRVRLFWASLNSATRASFVRTLHNDPVNNVSVCFHSNIALTGTFFVPVLLVLRINV